VRSSFHRIAVELTVVAEFTACHFVDMLGCVHTHKRPRQVRTLGTDGSDEVVHTPFTKGPALLKCHYRTNKEKQPGHDRERS
jgi:hypothetical protein